MMRRITIVLFCILLLLMTCYFWGPTPQMPIWDLAIPTVPSEPTLLENYIVKQEQKHQVKLDNEARILWANENKEKTEYSVIYLHGFSASQAEGSPSHTRFAQKFGCNLYLARLADHGIDTVDHLLYFTPDRSWYAAKQALAIGNAIGNKVIVMSTSTGGTLALALAAIYPRLVYALINMSPNIRINNPFAFLLNKPWGLQIARMVEKSDYKETKQSIEAKKYWYGKYRLEALPQLQELIEYTMHSDTYEKISQPSLTLYYYKDEQHQDEVVEVAAMLDMNKQLGTLDSMKKLVAIPNAGTHVIGSYIFSKDVDGVIKAMEKFAIETLHMEPLHSKQ